MEAETQTRKQGEVITLRFKPHRGQTIVHNSKARFRVLVAGVRWGKTLFGVHEAFWYLGKPNAKVWWVAPKYSEGLVAWRKFLEWIPNSLIKRINRKEYEIEMVNGSMIWWKTSQNPDDLRAEGLDFLVIDEAAYVKPEAWFGALRTRLSDADKIGKALFIGTPKGLNWFYQIYLLGKSGVDPDWQSFRFPTWTNPYIDPKEIQRAKKDLPERIFRQEYGAEFLSDLGSIFNLRSDEQGRIRNVKGEFEPPIPGERYYMGVDFGKQEDFTVITVLNSQGHVVYFDRFKAVGYPLQVKKVVSVAEQYDAEVMIDSRGIGEPLFDYIRQSWSKVRAYDINSSSKIPLIDNLAIALEKGEVTFPEIPQLIDELRIFGTETDRAGSARYRAPRGFHDDCVISLALAYWCMRKRAPLSFTFLEW